MLTQESEISAIQTIRVLKELSRPYVIYGSGRYALELIRLIRETVHYMPDFIIDHNVNKDELEGIKVRDVIALEGSLIDTVLLASEVYGDKMRKILTNCVRKKLVCFDCYSFKETKATYDTLKQIFYQIKDTTREAKGLRLIKPSFIVAGVQKCGTTALFQYLQEHPDIVGTFAKEIEYFLLDEMYERGEEEYHSFFYFPDSLNKSISFEASPDYFPSSAITAARIYKYDPTIKLVMIFRDPIERAYSAWNMYAQRLLRDRDHIRKYILRRDPRCRYEFDIIRTKDQLEDFYSALLTELEARDKGMTIEADLLETGFYAKHLKDFYTFFKTEQILLLLYDEFRLAPQRTLDTITDFVGVKRFTGDTRAFVRHNAGQYSARAMDHRALTLLQNVYREANDEFYSIIGKKADWL